VPNNENAKKRVRINEKENLRNKSIRSNLRTVIKKAHAAIESGAPDKEAAVVKAVKTIDKACAKGIIHKNNAARKKSKLTVKLNQAS